MATTSLDILVRARDNASRTLNGVASAGKNVNSSLSGAGTKANKAGGFFKSAGGKLVGMIGGAVVAQKVFSFFKTGSQEAQDADKSIAGLTSTLHSMGRKIPVKELSDLATNLEHTTGFTAEAIQSGQRLFSTFGGISDKLVKDLTPSVVDFAAQFTHGNIDAAAVMMGKALNDPAKGLSKLSRAGVTFTDQEAAMITKMSKAGDTAGAQAAMMKLLHPQIDGAGKASQTMGKKFSNSFGAMRESITRILLPAFNLIGGALSTVFGWLERGGPIVVAVTSALGALAAVMLVTKIHTAFLAKEGMIYSAWTAIQTIQSGIASAAQWVWNASLMGFPVLWIVAALALIVGGIIWFVKKTELGKKIFELFGKAVSAIFGWLKGAFKRVKQAAVDFWNGVKSVLDDFKRGWTKVWGALVGIVKKVWDSIKSVVRIAFTILTGYVKIWIGIFKIAFNILKVVATIAILIVIVAIKALLPVFKAVFHLMSAAAKVAWHAIRAVVRVVVGAIKSVIHTLTPPVKRVFNGLKRIALVAWAGIKAVWSVASAVFGRIFRAVMTVARPIWNTLKTVVVGVWKAIKRGWDAAKGFFQGIWNAVTAGAQSAFNGLVSLWNNTVGRIAHGQNIGVGPLHVTMPDLRISSLEHGGTVLRTGLAMVHEGEQFSGVGRRFGPDKINVSIDRRRWVEQSDFQTTYGGV